MSVLAWRSPADVLALFGLGPWEVVAILVVVLLLFGGAKLPELARSLGRAVHIFRKELNAPSTDDHAKDKGVPPDTKDDSQPPKSPS